MKAINITFRCCHDETLTKKEMEKQGVWDVMPFMINGKSRGFSGLYCLKCSTPKISYAKNKRS